MHTKNARNKRHSVLLLNVNKPYTLAKAVSFNNNATIQIIITQFYLRFKCHCFEQFIKKMEKNKQLAVFEIQKDKDALNELHACQTARKEYLNKCPIPEVFKHITSAFQGSFCVTSLCFRQKLIPNS